MILKAICNFAHFCKKPDTRIYELNHTIELQKEHISKLNGKLTLKQQQINQTNAYWKSILRKNKVK